MFRTDKYLNKMNGLIAFLTLCFLIALWPSKTIQDDGNQEIYDPEVTEYEIKEALKNGISFNDTDQFGITTVENWLPIQSELAKLNLALEYFSRLNLDKVLKRYDELEIETEKCSQLQLNQDLEKFIEQFKTTNQNDTSISEYLVQLQERKVNLSDWQIQLQNRLEIITNEERSLKQQQTEYYVDQKEAGLIDNKKQLLKQTENTINALRLELTDLDYKIKNLSQEDDEDLSVYYQRDQEQAKILRSLLKPTGNKTSNPLFDNNKIHNENLQQLVMEFDQGIKQLNLSTDFFINGLSFSPDQKKNELQELQLQQRRAQLKLENYLQTKIKQEQDIDEKTKQKEAKDQKFQDVVARLEEIRNEKNGIKKQLDECQKQLKNVIIEIKNIIPVHKDQSNEKLSAQKLFKDYLYKHLEEDQNCYEKCMEYKSVKQYIEEGRYRQSLKSIQKHFQQLERLFSEFKI